MNRLKEEQREEKRRLLGLPIYSASEEILSAVSHGIGVLLSIAALVLLLVSAPGDPIVIVSLSIYSATLILLYLVSTLYHALGVNKGKRVFRILDHCSIFADRRHLYAFEPCHHRRNGGVGAVWRHLGGSRGGNRI